ncbi:MAG: hypothetical protein ACPGWR_19175 [Ardenticatenaceae bacterium]
MNDKAVILWITKKDASSPFKDEMEKQAQLQVILLTPPSDLLDLPQLITLNHADAVIIEQDLPQEVDYMGIDAFELLQNALPSLPLYVLTESLPGPELNELPTGQLIRIDDFFAHEAARRAFFFQLVQAAQNHQQQQKEEQNQQRLLQELWAKNGITQEVVNNLAQLHFEADRAIEQVIWIPNGKEEEEQVRLLEVNRTTIPSEHVLVFHFAPSLDIPFRQAIADVTPAEWKQIQSGKLSLPKGWNLKTAEVFQRPEYAWKGKQGVG